MVENINTSFQCEGKSNGLCQSDKLCKYCHKQGHWKADCLSFKSKPKNAGTGVQIKGASLAAQVQQLSAFVCLLWEVMRRFP